MRRNRSGRGLMAAGLLCLAAAFALTGYNLWDGHRAEQAADTALEQIRAVLPPSENAAMPAPVQPTPEEPSEAEAPPVLTIDGQTYLGMLSIPGLDLEVPVLNDWSYPRLKLAPCRFQGSAREDGFILIGHNYPRHFGQLKSLSPGNEVYFTDAEGNRYSYEVSTLEELGGGELDALTDGGWPLTLVSCTWSGQGRVVVRCVRRTPPA